jgi:hypothetical protein
MVTGSAIESVLDEDIPAPAPGDPKRQLAGPTQGLADHPVPPGRGDQEQKTVAAGPQ